MLRRAQAARLLITDSSAPWPRLVLLRRDKATVGRYKQSALFIGDLRVSHRHALIKYRAGRYFITDLRSEAGTFVNGRRIRRRVLKHGDLIRFAGAVSYRFIDPDAFLRRRTRRIRGGAIAVTILILGIAAHLKGWDGGWLSSAHIKRVLFFFQSAPNSDQDAVSQEVTSVVAPIPFPSNGKTLTRIAQSSPSMPPLITGSPQPFGSPNPLSATIEAPSWLAQFNHYRTMAMLPPLAENSQLSAAMTAHSRYLIENYFADIQNGAALGDIAYAEAPSLRDYSAAGASEASNSRIAWGCGRFSAAREIDHWIWNPFERLAMLDPRLTQAGFGGAVAGNYWVVSLRMPPPPGPAARFPAPVKFPADGASLPSSWTGDSGIDPLASCSGYALPAGMPITFQLGNLYEVHLSAHSLTLDGRSVEHCAFDAHNYLNANTSLQEYGRWQLHKTSAVVIVPRIPLQVGAEYRVSVTINDQTYAWAFRVVSDSSDNLEEPQRPATISREVRSVHFSSDQ